MSKLQTATPPETAKMLLDKLPSQNVHPLWTVMSAMVTPQPSPKAKVALWKYKELRPLLLQAGETISSEEAERRVLMLTNPALSMST
jgi:gentisate 1,2-dioxygenase